ncbi:hypothetical protein [Henriciella marina]|nr:hypothetical protein [Henriciella marina]
MTDPKLQEEEARQGETGKGVRYVLVISTVAAVIAMGLILAFVI